MNALLSIHWVLVSAVWYFGNGILHDIFILKNHKGPYDRDLLRLLMDGHVLMLSGAIAFVCYLMMQHKMQYGGLIGVIVAVGMLIYCAMIFPFLKSFVTMFISLMLLIVSVRSMYN